MTKIKEFKFLGLALMLVGMAHAQDANDAKKAIDAEQYQKAKTTLKSLISSNPDEGKNYFLLGEVYLTQTEQDSAAMYFNKGAKAKNDADYNTIGLGHIDLNNGSAAAAQTKFDAVEKNLKKKDVEQLVYIGKAYTTADTPDYAKAIAVLNKAVAKDAKYAPAYLALGEAYYRSNDQNNAYKNFRTASELDPSLLRAQLQLGVITKNTGAAFPEAVKFFEGIVAKNANYGPVYRELAETYYKWGNAEYAKKKEYNAKALESYRKYMSLTDYSLNSRMRYADFLLLTGDYKALETEANTMQQMDKVNPRILRYLAYSAYENGNFEGSLKAMKEFLAKVEPKRVIARDYLYLGLAQLATTVGDDGKGNSIIKDQVVFDEAIANIKKAAEMDINITNEFNAIAKKLFKGKLYGPAAIVFDVATTNPNSRSLFEDNFYFAYSTYYDYVNKTPEAKKAYVDQLKKADTALAKVIELSPTSQDAYLYKAKINQAIASNESYIEMAKSYDKYIEIVNTAGAAEVTKQSKNLLEAYSNAGAYYAVTDKAKAKDYFTKALAIDPADTYVKGELAKLK
ncbi:tetratricopeptide repeat protein [Flavobacterium sp. RHBU_24]|uniref:tetratricopeptide repeat protein n=1 Tax=Flavobacterium sp. RHBU_24 TaxID=3391185 RepID=UPI003984B31F